MDPVTKPEAELEIVLRHLNVLHVERGDTLVLRLQQRASSAECMRIGDFLRASFPGHLVLVLDDGAELGVVRGLPDATAP